MDAATLAWIVASGLCTAVGGLFLLLVRSPSARLLDVLLGFTAGVIAWALHHYWELWIGHAHLPARIGAVFVPCIAATIVYFALLAWLRVPQVHDVMGVITQKLRSRAKPPENT